MKQIYHPYYKWECYKNGMWRSETREYQELHINEIIEFTGDYILYGQAMFEVINKWKYSCENFLTNKNINRRAYIGHAACCFAKKYPEYLVREAWGRLTNLQRNLANNKADAAIYHWENFVHKKNDNQLSIW